MPFGLSYSASTFVRQLQGALAPLLRQGWVKSYLDAPLVFYIYKDWEKFFIIWEE